MRAPHRAAELIDTVCSRVRDRLPSEQGNPCESFVRQYDHRVPAEDLFTRDALDLYGAAVAQWNLAQHPAPGCAKVHMYNADFEQHGWRSQHTVIEIVGEDMAFLVDSVTMELPPQICEPTFWLLARSRPSSGQDFFASRTIVIAASLVIGATRAPALIDGILAFDRRGQMTGGRRELAYTNNLVSGIGSRPAPMTARTEQRGDRCLWLARDGQPAAADQLA